MAGYSGTPLATKLGIKAGHTVGVINAPDHFAGLVEPLPEAVTVVVGVRSRRDVVVAFFVRRRELEQKLAAMTKAVFPAGAIWIAWPKRAAKVPTDGPLNQPLSQLVTVPAGATRITLKTGESTVVIQRGRVHQVIKSSGSDS